MDKGEFYDKGYYAGLAAEPRFKTILKIAGRMKPQVESLLDVGCGDGSFTVLIKQATEAKEAVGIEIAKEAVIAAQHKGIKAIQLDIDTNQFPFNDGSFDLVYCGEIIEHLFNPDHLLREVHRVLKPGGIALISTPNLAGWPNRLALLLGYQPYPTAVSPEHEHIGKLLARGYEGQWGHIRVFTAKALKEELQLHDFEIMHMLGCPVLITSQLPPIIGRFAANIDKVMSMFPPLATRLIVVVKKTNTKRKSADVCRT